ncbi:MAG: DPP IV N-terminal domain-containing protein, partial [Ginsengibacter sp.]
MKAIISTLLFCFLSHLSPAQVNDTLPASEYARAENMLYYKTRNYIEHESVEPHWFNSDQFWYRRSTPQGSEFVSVRASDGNRQPAFDHGKLSVAISNVTGKKYGAGNLPFEIFNFLDGQETISFKVDGKQWQCDLRTYICKPGGLPFNDSTKSPSANEVISPDGKVAAFLKDYNLWIKKIGTGVVKQLTSDGEKYYGYATDNAGWRQSGKPILRWSPNSKKIATFRQDERNVGDMYLVTTNVGHPTLKSWKYPLPGDSNIIMIERVIIDIDTPKIVRLNVPPDPHRASLGDDISRGGILSDVDWSADGSKLAFVSTSRDHKIEKFRIADAASGEVTEVFEENAPTQFESGQLSISWRYLAKTDEIFWYSERDNHGHLYLYDARNGKVKHQITNGNYTVTKLIQLDEKNRILYFNAVGKDVTNPYFSHLYKIDFSGKHLTDLTPEAGNHSVEISPSTKYFIDSYSQPDVAPVMNLRSLSGKLIATLEKTDISRLMSTGWQPPKPIHVLASDGITEIYGLMFTPSGLDSSKKYPVVDYIYPGPQGGGVRTWSFTASRSDHQALAELGFIVVVLEGSSNPLRSKSFHDMNYGNMAENTLPDQVTGIRQLAMQYSFMDTTRVGIWGHSGGGFAAAAAMFRYPDFFKVGISESGNHDNRNYEDDWGERYIGLLTQTSGGTDNYNFQANQLYAKNLKGKLM